MPRFVHKTPPVDTPEYRAEWLARVWERSVVAENGCILWQGFVNHKGYGMTTYHSNSVAIHRKILEWKLGRHLVKGEFSCHTCDTRHCWNEAHLWLGDVTANNRDMLAKGRNYWANVTRCRNGHEFTPENTYVYALEPNKRKCKACMLARARIKLGWPEHLAFTLPAGPQGYQPPELLAYQASKGGNIS